jgi:LysR family nitrogen assimilation transcriptional regulator
MDIKQLRYFVGVATAGSLTQAAEKLHVAQPALSQQILKLERAVGERLMLRHSRGITLTEAGARLLSHARFILEQIEQAQRDIADFRGEPRGVVRVGMPRGASDLFGIEMLARARRLYPDLKIAVIDRVSEELVGLLADGQLDLGLTFVRPESAWIECEPLYTERLCFAVPPLLHTRALRGRVVSFVQVSHYPLALPTVGHILRTLVDRVAEDKGIALDLRFEVDSVQLIRDAVARNFACTILPYCSLVESTRSADVRVYQISEPAIARALHLVRSRRRPPTKAVSAVRELIIESIRDRIAAPRFSEVYETA